MTDRPGGPGPANRFDRIRPPERRLLERPADERDVDPQGRAALFPQGRPASGPAVTVHCSRCDATSPVDAGTALRSALPLFLVAPWRDHPVFAVCPSCARRSWLRPGLDR